MHPRDLPAMGIFARVVEQGGFTAAAQHLQVSKSAVSKAVAGLEDRLGVRLWEFASRTPGAVGLREIARPWLGAVHERVRQHVQLGVRAGRDVLFIERMSAQDAVLNATLIGGRIPLFASSSGLVLAAYGDPSVVEDVILGGLRAYTDRTIVDPDER